jgi:predicted amino acid dehydrogenase
VSIAVTLMPALDGRGALGTWSAAVVEAVLVASRPSADLPLDEDTYLDLIADLDWAPAVRYLQPAEASVNRFAFVIHPLSVRFIHGYPPFRWTRVLPDGLVEAVAAFMPPVFVSRITGARSAATGQRVEGFLISLGATPRQMMARGERFTYTRLNQAARMAERLGARIMGLGAFTSVVGDAGVTVAHEADIAITSGNSLTVAATLEAAKQAALKMGATDLRHGKALVVGATGSIGAVCARLLAQAIHDVVLVSVEPEKLIELKRRIQAETPGSRVTIATRTEHVIGDCDLIVAATSAFGQRVIDITRCKPGAVVCDVARPPDISEAEAALRPDVLVIESGEVVIPGNVDIGYDIGLPPGTSYACLAETALLAMEGRFEDYTLGRQIEMDRVKEIYRLFKKHGFALAGLRSFGRSIDDTDLEERRRLANELRSDREKFERLRAEALDRLATLPASSKGVTQDGVSRKTLAWVAAGAGAAAVALAYTHRRTRSRTP